MSAETGRWENKIVGSGHVDPAHLVANPRNSRIHPKYQTEAIKAVLDEIGWIRPIIVNEITGHIVDGHARVSEAISADQSTVPVSYVRLSEDEEALALATLDPVRELTMRNAAKAQAIIDELADPENEQLQALYDSLQTGGIEDYETPIDSKGQRTKSPEVRVYIGTISFPVDRELLAAWQQEVQDYLGSTNPDVIFEEVAERLGLSVYLDDDAAQQR